MLKSLLINGVLIETYSVPDIQTVYIFISEILSN